MRNALLIALLTLGLSGVAHADEQLSIIRDKREVKPGDVYFDQRHNDSWAADALAEVAGSPTPANATPQQMGELVYAQLQKLPAYGEKTVSNMPPAIPDWFLDGYTKFKGPSVQRSRYFDGVLAGTQQADSDIAALYGYWSLYDAEWFSLSRNPGFKAWLSAAALTYPPQWIRLQGESKAQLHARLVTPRQTPDEPWRELDNWINSFTSQSSVSGHGQLGAFIKPKVRDALVQELLAAAGIDTDARFYAQRAYTGDAPARVGLESRKFYLLGALTLEYFQEIYAAHPDTKQPLFFRDYFVERFRANS